MMYLKSIAFSAALLVVAISGASASQPQCTEVTFPNIFHFGECLKEPQDLCHGQGSVAEVVGNIFICGLNGIAHLDIGSQLYLLEGLMSTALQRFGMGSMVNSIFTLCKTVGGTANGMANIANGFFGGIFSPFINAAKSVLPLGDCSGMNVGKEIMCGQPVVFEFPGVLDLGKCVNETLSICVGTQTNQASLLSSADLVQYFVLQAQVIEQFFQTITCVFTSVITNSPAETADALACTVIKAFVQFLNAGPFKIVGTLVSQLEATIGYKCI
uniref:Secreted protein n=1 Tax=Amblyomma triste TaxID=251400 RepID=A0A023GB95_AMBTT